VLPLPLRNLAYLAKEWATLHVLASGRSIFGIGVGWHEREFGLMGVPHRERGARLDEMIEAVCLL
jgi:alkanesulfonate monooxygenase SsuD/methylene tetrahydromethanopterin reductase-like flavin-dependent oxidoreductase (luciferase family)